MPKEPRAQGVQRVQRAQRAQRAQKAQTVQAAQRASAILVTFKGAVPDHIAREPRGKHLPCQACCKGVTEEEAARNISTFLSAPIV